ncbi:MAG: quinone-dependent dihydroorotate dehydrogenase [Patescibacteria group bacterium]|nr:quinone-dependent dihydroorotate dehydrogenase [Patescibacteria group bacterium]
MKSILRKIAQLIYKNGIKPVIFKIDPEKVHDKGVELGVFFGKYRFTKKTTSFLFNYSDKSLEQNIFGIKFKNPVGLAAGYDKYARMIQIIGDLGFGFEEVGSISDKPSAGNPKPRLWRLIKSRGLIVGYGLNNDGAQAAAEQIKNLKLEIPIGISIAKTNSPKVCSLEESITDVVSGFKTLAGYGDYFTFNISCPNTLEEGLFYNPKNLEIALKEISALKISKPIFIKMSPDLSLQVVDEIIEISRKYGIKGFVLSNITKHREMMKNLDKEELKKIDHGKGGISGKPVEDLADNLIKYVYQKTRGEFIIIGCGGIFSAEDAYKKIRLGASLVQLITGMIFEGPQLIGQINEGLAKLVKKDGFKNISEAIGIDVK